MELFRKLFRFAGEVDKNTESGSEYIGMDPAHLFLVAYSNDGLD